MVHSQFKDVFGRNISCDRKIKVSGGSVRDDECRAMINGDFNKDGKVDIKDVICIMRDNIGLYNANAYQKFVGDVNKDNKISVKDAVIVQRCLVGSGNTYSVGAEAEVTASAEPVILPQQSEQPTEPPTEKPTQPNTNMVVSNIMKINLIVAKYEDLNTILQMQLRAFCYSFLTN